ncbi:MAG: hypothetical protein R2932_59380 [Caldilineaceae bacterium]
MADEPISATDLFLAQNGAVPGDPADPKKVPYYLLIVGDPAAVPYEFQIQLAVVYAVGRIYFETLDEYRQYAQSVVAAAQAENRRARAATFFGTANKNDNPTNRSAVELVAPLATALTAQYADWSIRSMVGPGQAEKAQLATVLGGAQTPALLFTATHGMGFTSGDARQLADTGALLCQEWVRAPTNVVPIDKKIYFSAEDVAPNAQLLGSIVFTFACYSAGSPQIDQFPKVAGQIKTIAPQPFLARLPQTLLAHPNGGALAVIGHVDRAWTTSFSFREPVLNLKISAIETFASTLSEIMSGNPLGAAFDYFAGRYATYATRLTGLKNRLNLGQKVDNLVVSSYWRYHNDARNYIIIGDPAVQLNLAPPIPAGGGPVG